MVKMDAAMAVFLTLEEPTKPMHADAKAAGAYNHVEMGKSYDRIAIVTIREMLEEGRRLEIPMSMEVLKAAQKAINEEQIPMF
jgi:site-specific DNA-methyltransferase (adenine-specific)